MDQSITHPNMYSIGEKSMSFGVMPITIDNTRGIPYLQYSMMKPNDPSVATSVLKDDSISAQLPYGLTTDTSAMLFSLAFVIPGNTAITVTPQELSKMLSPVVFQYPNPGTEIIQLEWDWKNPSYSIWGTSGGYKTLTPGKQYVVTTSPMEVGGPVINNWFNNLRPGICYFAINNGDAGTKFNGTKICVLGVSARLQLTERVV